MTARKQTKAITLPRPDFGTVTIEQAGSEWRVGWLLTFSCHNALDAVKVAGELVAIEMAAHGDWEASVSLKQDERPGLPS